METYEAFGWGIACCRRHAETRLGLILILIVQYLFYIFFYSILFSILKPDLNILISKGQLVWLPRLISMKVLMECHRAPIQMCHRLKFVVDEKLRDYDAGMETSNSPANTSAAIASQLQSIIVTASWAEIDGSLRLVRNGIAITQHVDVVLGGIKGMWNA